MRDHHYMEWYNRYSHPRLIRDLHYDTDAWMEKMMQLGQRLFQERDNMTTASGRAVIDDMERVLAQWQQASKRDY